jgi:hypothetical protein
MWTRKGVLIHLFWPRLRIGGNAMVFGVFGVLLITDYRLPMKTSGDDLQCFSLTESR